MKQLQFFKPSSSALFKELSKLYHAYQEVGINFIVVVPDVRICNRISETFEECYEQMVSLEGFKYNIDAKKVIIFMPRVFRNELSETLGYATKVAICESFKDSSIPVLTIVLDNRIYHHNDEASHWAQKIYKAIQEGAKVSYIGLQSNLDDYLYTFLGILRVLMILLGTFILLANLLRVPRFS